MAWVFEQIDAARSGSSGDVSKLFRNEPVKHPGLLQYDAPGPDATVMAREVLQNSWDAANELRTQSGAGTVVPFALDFRFDRLDAGHRSQLAAVLDLAQLADRARGLDWAKIGLPDDSWLAAPDRAALTTLTIAEHGTTGMYGPWEGAKSKMYLALVSIGFTVKPSGAGGSYGYGKAGLIRGSATRTVVAYSCFRARADDPGVTRRLLGMTYWGPHDVDGTSYSGFARFGEEDPDGSVRPFVNEDADRVAASIGLSLRDPDDVDQLGTTFVVIDPTVHAVELRRAIERNWWPVLHADPTFEVRITDLAGRRHPPRPERVAELAEFLHGFELATGARQAAGQEEKSLALQRLTVDDVDFRLGSLGLVADRSGWSYPADDGAEHRSLVALVRGPRMVVEYLEAGVAKPFVRGTFVAHDDVDDLLRQTEPRGHDAWQPEVGDDSIDAAAPAVAKAILGRIRNNVATFRRDIKPPIPDRRDLRLPELEKLFRLVVESDGTNRPPPPPGGPRTIAIQIPHCEAEPVEDGRIRLNARVVFQLTDRHPASRARVRVGVRFPFVEETRSGARAELAVSPPAGFVAVGDNVFEGEVGADPVALAVTSAPYPAGWSGRMVATADIVDEPGDSVPDQNMVPPPVFTGSGDSAATGGRP